jgi:signal transduction histidine kinase
LYALESFLFYDSGLKTSASQGILAGLSGLLPLSILYFLAAFLKFEFNLPIKIIILYSLLVSALLLFFGNYNYDAFTFLSLLWVISLLSISAAGLYISIRAYQDKRLESGPIVLGVMALALGALFETINIFIRFRNIARTLSGRILTAHENERKRLAREIHDGLGQRFMAVMFNLQRINRTLKDNRVTDVIQEVSGSIDELRDISRGLRPSLLDEMGLFAAVQSFCKSFSKKTGLPVRVAGDPGVKLPTPVEENLFRILQESLNNVVKHADAGNAEVILKHSDRNIRLRIEDDGKGFDYYKALSDGKGVGLSTMKERVDLIEGSLDIRSRPGKGTVIKVEVPLR